MWNFISRGKDQPKKIQQLKVRRVEFLGEQLGHAETEIKEKFIKIFEANRRVVLAYLVTVRYPDAEQPKVALCLTHSTGKDLALVQELGAEFRRMFNVQESLDIMFIKPGEMERIATVARPFYRSPLPETR